MKNDITKILRNQKVNTPPEAPYRWLTPTGHFIRRTFGRKTLSFLQRL